MKNKVDEFLDALDNYCYEKIEHQIYMNADSSDRFCIETGSIDRAQERLKEKLLELLDGKSNKNE